MQSDYSTIPTTDKILFLLQQMRNAGKASQSIKKQDSPNVMSGWCLFGAFCSSI